ncbi:MAG: DUF5615 family PIN-like protein [Planctomycetes bacterium]|nr:DUF5615 family PIN-like protein [Planctomycetota bacterium]
MGEPIRFYFDHHVPAAVADGLRRRGIDVLTSTEAGRSRARDLDLVRLSRDEGRVIVTFDEDFLVLAGEVEDHAGIVYCPATKYGIGQLIHALFLVHGVLDVVDMRNHVEFL